MLACTTWNTDAGIAQRRVALAAIATEMGATYDEVVELDLGVIAHFMNPAMPTLAQMADSSIKLASAVEGFSDTDTFWETNGFDADARKRIKRELRVVRARQVLLRAICSMSLLMSATLQGTARLYETTDWQMADRKVHYLAGFLNEGDRDRFRDEVSDLTRYYCMRAAYDNMVENCRARRVKWARVPTGLETCAFCFMLASRGFAYTSEQKAGEGSHGYHDNCDCVLVPGFEGKDGNPRVKIDGYDPEAMYRNWLACEETVGGRRQARTEWEKLADEDRAERIARCDGDDAKAFARFERNRILREVETRDWHWLYTGEEPKVAFDSQAVKSDVRENRPHEEETAEKLALHGITPFFVRDYEEYPGANGRSQTRGLADLVNGVELKTLGASKDEDGETKKGASTYNTINGYIKRSSKKKSNMKILIFDNSNNDDMSDVDLAGHIRRSQAFRRGRIYILGHDGRYTFIR